MNGNDKSPNARHETEDEQTQLKRERAFALFLARNHARNHGLPLPNPEDIGPAAFVRLSPDMTREQKVQNLKAALEKRGITVHPRKSRNQGGGGSS